MQTVSHTKWGLSTLRYYRSFDSFHQQQSLSSVYLPCNKLATSPFAFIVQAASSLPEAPCSRQPQDDDEASQLGPAGMGSPGSTHLQHLTVSIPMLIQLIQNQTIQRPRKIALYQNQILSTVETIKNLLNAQLRRRPFDFLCCLLHPAAWRAQLPRGMCTPPVASD